MTIRSKYKQNTALQEHTCTTTFEEDARFILSDLRGGLLAVIRALPGGVRKAADIHKATRVPPAIGWGVYRAATAENVFEVGRFVPKRDALKKFLRSAASLGVADAKIDAVEKTLDAFEDMIERHVGDREMLDSVLAGFTSNRDPAMDLRQKRAAYKANCYLAGMTSRATISCIILYPGRSPERVDAVTLSGQLKLVQLHPETSACPIWVRSTARKEDQIFPLIESTNDQHRIGLIPAYCSEPMPEVIVQPRDDGAHQAMLNTHGIGNLGAVDYFTGYVIPSFCPVAETELEISTGLSFPPTETLVRDVIVHESLWQDAEATIGVYRSMPNAVDTTNLTDSRRTVVQEHLETLDIGIENMYCAEMPRYTEMLADAISRVGQDPSAFRGYRCRVEYPILYSIVRILLRSPSNNESEPFSS